MVVVVVVVEGSGGKVGIRKKIWLPAAMAVLVGGGGKDEFEDASKLDLESRSSVPFACVFHVPTLILACGVHMELNQQLIFGEDTPQALQLQVVFQSCTPPEWKEELRCLKRSDLIQSLADSLPLDTIRFGCHILEVKFDPLTSQPLLQLQDGSIIKSKVVIGCDGVNSIFSELLGLKATTLFASGGIRGFTNYPSGHGFSNEFVRIRKNNILLGRMPVDDNLVHWFLGRPWTPSDSRVSKEPELIKQTTIESIMGFPTEYVEMIKKCDLDDLTLTSLRYRAPWDILLGNFRNGTVIVAGDAMHVMGPYLGQGGSAAIEDAIVLARNLAQVMCTGGSKGSGKEVSQMRIETAMDQYVKERRMRLFMLATQTYLVGMLVDASSSVTKLVIIIALIVFFSDSLRHARYNCGRL
ncbi:Monooxygenase [Macleaya cordata]|uniref:Monooxygenase n=1 Tax=Macleaya cordata TaxID=56857 RepID=A0A200QKP3_MACCD|nr:Monooxygenase [Macleaya cordata]